MIKKLAFLGRYGHQPIQQLMHMPSRYVNQLVEEVNDLIEGEIAAMKRED